MSHLPENGIENLSVARGGRSDAGRPVLRTRGSGWVRRARAESSSGAMPFDGRLICAVMPGREQVPARRRQRVHVEVDRAGLGRRDDQVDEHRRLAELGRVGERERAACRLRVHEHRRDHEHRDAEHELAAHRPAQVAHVGVGGSGRGVDADGRFGRSRPLRSTSTGRRGRTMRRLQAASASSTMNTAIFTSRMLPYDVWRNASSDQPTCRHAANIPVATITITLVERDGREVVGRSARRRDRGRARSSASAASPPSQIAHRDDVQRVERDRELDEGAGRGVAGEPGRGRDRDAERNRERPPPPTGAPVLAHHEEQRQHGEQEQRAGSPRCARNGSAAPRARPTCGRSPTARARPRTDLAAAGPRSSRRTA